MWGWWRKEPRTRFATYLKPGDKIHLIVSMERSAPDTEVDRIIRVYTEAYAVQGVAVFFTTILQGGDDAPFVASVIRGQRGEADGGSDG